MTRLKKDIILNGTDSIAVVKDEGVVYRLTPVQELFTLTIENIVAQTKIDINLQQVLQGHFKVTQMNSLLPIDANLDEPNTDYGGASRTFVVLIKTFQNKVPIQVAALRTHRGTYNDPDFFFDANSRWELYSEVDVSRLIFYLTPVFISKNLLFN